MTKGTLVKEKRAPSAGPDLDPVRIKTQEGEFTFKVEPTGRTEFYRNVRAVLDGKADLIVKPAQARETMQVIDAVRTSASTKSSVKLQNLQ